VKSKPVDALSVVADDLNIAAEHYASWRPDGREYLFQKYDETVSWIAWNPDSFPRKFGRVQRAILKQSYYIVYFVQEVERSLVLAVLDGRRKPGEIRRIVFGRRGGAR
jgi:plasmid stabilization system protein ParE